MMVSSTNAPESAFTAKENRVEESGNVENTAEEDFSLDEFKEKNAQLQKILMQMQTPEFNGMTQPPQV